LAILPKESVGIELGVVKGTFSEQIIKVVRPRELHLVDLWWLEHGEYFPNLGSLTDHGRLKTKDAYDNVMRMAKQYSARTNVIVHVGDDLEYLRTLPDGYLDWAYIDTTHEYEHTWCELEILRDKVKTGGLITGHDWQEDPNHMYHGVYQAVKHFCATYGWKVILVANTAGIGQWAIQQRR